MSYIKKLVMQGFKSFARKTEMQFTPEINVVVGPNGSGKSNVADALCFVLGRLSAKSMRAARASNLIFSGTKAAGPAQEASVEIVFDNSQKTFAIEEKELSIKRILRKNGQSIYRINGKTHTRQDVLAVLAQGGIDPNGFNIILQNEIQNFAVGTADERRRTIEEVAGISIYESRKEKSIHELEKTSAKLKEIEAVLRERTTFLTNLEKEKEAAEKKKKLEIDLRKSKKSVIYIDLTSKKKEKDTVERQVAERQKEINSHRKSIVSLKSNIETHEEKINELNAEIQRQTGLEQEQLNREISDLRADIAVLKVRIEAHEKKVKDIERQKTNFQRVISENELAVRNMREESPTVALIQKELEKKRKELEILEEQRRKHYTSKTELRSLKVRLEDKTKILQNYQNENGFLMKQVSSLTAELYDIKSSIEKVDDLKHELAENKSILDNFNKREKELEKIINVNESDIKREKEIVEKIEKLDVCPLCKSKVTEEHIKNIGNEIEPKIMKLQTDITNALGELNDIKEKRGFLNEDIDNSINEIQKRQSDLMKIKTIREKEEQVKIMHEKIESSKFELKELEKKKVHFESSFDENSTIEEKYETVQMEVQDISIRNKENLDSDIQYKQKELERAQISINQLFREEKDLAEEVVIVKKELENKDKALSIKKNKEEELRRKADKYIQQRNEITQKQRQFDRELSVEKNKVYNIESAINNFNVERARIDAQIQGLETDILEYPNVEIMKMPRDTLLQRVRRIEETLSRIGSVNMRALEVYAQVKEEYNTIKNKVETIGNEKEKIMKIIHKIDVEKKKVFIRIVEELNTRFERNFSQISTKGQVYLEIQNKKDPFDGGVDVILKTGHGKYFDIKSLSGGEKTMVALSLIFAIQELSPYAFYILDEIDASLDKRNASRLADFLKRYAQKGQYVVISHNDEIITNAKSLFGVSMHEGVSKLTSLLI
ncbi:MAG: chromosome segregation SMC family protein [Nanoarchaeota archaeon]|jgi:chromosome segregation protein|nr:chromosome segregation SMC family protein [Nanoarchaeota archaeon]